MTKRSSTPLTHRVILHWHGLRMPPIQISKYAKIHISKHAKAKKPKMVEAKSPHKTGEGE